MDSRQDKTIKFTEESRADNFNNTAKAWDEESELVVNALRQMVQDQKNDFFTIYDFARQQRSLVAKKLNHQPLTSFGKIRHGISGDDFSPSKYSEHSKMQITVAALMNFLDTQRHLLSAEQSISDQQKYTVYSAYSSDDWQLIYIPISEVGEIHSSLLKTTYARSNPMHYQECLELLNPALRKIQAAYDNEDEFIFRIGLMVYDLSRLNLLQRGSAATTLWVGTAIGSAKIKNFSFAKINDIPFDIYAQVQLDRKQYATDFAKSIKPNFKTNPTYMNLSIVERQFLKLFVGKLIDIWTSADFTPSQNKKSDLDTLYFMKIIETDFDSLATAFGHIKNEIERCLDTPMDDKSKQELKIYAKYAERIIGAMQAHPEFDRQSNEGNFSTDGFSFVLTAESIKCFARDPHYFFSNKDKDFISTVFSGLQAQLRRIYKDDTSSAMTKLAITLTHAYYGNPINRLIDKLEILQNQKWSTPIDALTAAAKELQPQLEKLFQTNLSQSMLALSHRDILQLIDQLKNHALEKVMEMGTYGTFEYFANTNPYSQKHRL